MNSEANHGKSRQPDDLVFVVQKHQASHLHYDFRLELDGVLKSWAVPKGPSLNPNDKRLAIMVEDHPFEYRTFEGVIAEGGYGAGEVIVWDQGTYSPLAGQTRDAMQEQLRKQFEQGALHFLLYGEKLRGEFTLIRSKRIGEQSWLLIKKRDQYASQTDILQQDRSVITGKRLGEIT
ncbi:DNA polymerase ligase N-terminal domain-containing protein [Dictyobacter aurantiacus]|uniref:DNA ligase D 3'-phosphoesterase domain-containing protein n=1 Tax=Dictyobacter aurantiacus TaxID=1936993 RepID=A0A401ZN16_9CHLR|nr:DNA polymerase ligase N-terminal domain-containing protein [Dictyobacter aurantiacus]GCE08259.1 hypothetical protein KDAU_55880 [Dictyobacter aurantiacus]